MVDNPLDRNPIAAINRLQDRIVQQFMAPYAIEYTYLAFAFVFFYFGFQKPADVISPVRTPVSLFIDNLSGLLSTLLFTDIQIPLEPALIFIGTYEMFLGTLFALCIVDRRLFRIVFWMFVPHQTLGFLSLVLTWEATFQPPWLSVLGVDIPWILGAYSAFVLKNVIFVGAFFLLASHELGGYQTGEEAGSGSDGRTADGESAANTADRESPANTADEETPANTADGESAVESGEADSPSAE